MIYCPDCNYLVKHNWSWYAGIDLLYLKINFWHIPVECWYVPRHLIRVTSKVESHRLSSTNQVPGPSNFPESRSSRVWSFTPKKHFNSFRAIIWVECHVVQFWRKAANDNVPGRDLGFFFQIQSLLRADRFRNAKSYDKSWDGCHPLGGYDHKNRGP